MISAKRLKEQFAALQKITAPGQGINRLAFSDADWQGRTYLMQLMKNAGLTLRVDAFGNVIGHYAGRDESLPAVMCGSHGDSVPEGGNYDGIFGILSAIETVRSMHEEGFVPDHPIEVVLFMCEESSRFGAATLGSRAMRGELSQDDLDRLKDKQGHSLREVLKGRGLDPDHIETAICQKPIKAFLETHIEQGKVLEHRHVQIGAVTGIAAPTRFRVYLHGSADHSGATPMNLRHDGLCAAAKIISKLEELAGSETSAPVVGTVGICDVTPDVMNVIPGEVSLGIDIRSISAAAKKKVTDELKAYIKQVTDERNIPYDIQAVSDEKPAVMNPEIVELVSDTAEKLGYTHITMPSGAGHDSMHWADYAPTGMIFIPCRDGISHNPAEYASIDDITAGANVFSEVIRTLANYDTVL